MSKTFAGDSSPKPAVPNRFNQYLACGDIVGARSTVRDPEVTSEGNSQQQSGSQMSSTESRRGGWNGSEGGSRFFRCLRLPEPGGQQFVWPRGLTCHAPFLGLHLFWARGLRANGAIRGVRCHAPVRVRDVRCHASSSVRSPRFLITNPNAPVQSLQCQFSGVLRFLFVRCGAAVVKVPYGSKQICGHPIFCDNATKACDPVSTD